MALPLALALGGVLSWVAGSLIARLVIALGIGVVTYIGVSAGMDTLQAMVVSELGGLPAHLIQALGLLRFDDAITLVFSAIAARVALASVGKLAFGRAGS